MGDWEAEESVDVLPELPGEDYGSSWSKGAQQKTRSWGIHLNRSVRSYKSAGFCIFPYLYMKIL